MNGKGAAVNGLVVDNLSKVYPGPTGELVILRELSLQLSFGANAAIMGPSGSGKSTLLHILGGLDKATSGSVRVKGRDVTALSDTELCRHRSETVGFIFQDHHLLPQLTALENVLAPILAQSRIGEEDHVRAVKLLFRVGLGQRWMHRPAQLSGGERQRVALARALVNEPMLLLCDEPTGNLDRKSADRVASLLIELARAANTMLLVVTHSQEIAKKFDRQYELLDGQLVDRTDVGKAAETPVTDAPSL